MSDINEIKRLIAESEGVELSNWNTVTHAQREAWASIETQGRAWIIDFITTIESQQEKLDLLTEPPSEIIEFLTEGLAQKDALIESQKEEIEKYEQRVWKEQLQLGQEVNFRLAQDQIESLKAITELAVNKFKEINIAYMLWIDSELDCDIAASRMDTIAESTLSEIERLQNAST